MLHVSGGLITRVRPRLFKPVLASSCFSSLSSSQKPVPVLTIKGPVSTTVQQRHFGNIFKKIKIGWLIGPPPKPDSPEDWDRLFKLVILLFVLQMIVMYILHQTGHASFKTEYFDRMRKMAFQEKEEEEKAYNEALELAKLRSRE